MLSSYEELRNRNIEDNKRILAELGIRNPFKPLPPVRRRQVKRKRIHTPSAETVKRRHVEADGGDLGTEYSSGRRRSARIKGITAPDVQEIQDDIDKELEADEDEKTRRKSLANRPMIYGAVPGVEVGTWWPTRIECNHANIHRPTVAGIHPGPDGAYSIALSGGYEDDIDMGDCFTYTGEGGRDLKGTASNPKNLRTAPQSRDQKLSRGNAALVKSVETKKPVRVIRGYKLRSPFAPEEGYRYDGLYQVEKYWYTTGMAGFGVFKFALRRLMDQAPPPWDIMDNLNTSRTEISNDSNNNSTIEDLSDTDKKNNVICDPDDNNIKVGSDSDTMDGKSNDHGNTDGNISKRDARTDNDSRSERVDERIDRDSDNISGGVLSDDDRIMEGNTNKTDGDDDDGDDVSDEFTDGSSGDKSGEHCSRMVVDNSGKFDNNCNKIDDGIAKTGDVDSVIYDSNYSVNNSHSGDGIVSN